MDGKKQQPPREQRPKRQETARGKWQERPRSHDAGENTVFIGKSTA